MLELIAMATMVIDHLGVVFFPDAAPLRVIGRLAFPLYCWGVVQGYRHTRDLGKYALRLLALALLSQAPFSLALGRPDELNVVFTLLLGFMAIYAIDRAGEARHAWLAAIAIAAAFVPMDYGLYGVSLIVLYHVWPRGRTMTAHFLLNAVYAAAFGWLIQLFSLAATWLAEQSPAHSRRLTGATRWVFRLFYPTHLLLLFLIERAADAA